MGSDVPCIIHVSFLYHIGVSFKPNLIISVNVYLILKIFCEVRHNYVTATLKVSSDTFNTQLTAMSGLGKVGHLAPPPAAGEAKTGRGKDNFKTSPN